MKNYNDIKWYQKSNGIILLLLLVFPIGLYLMWKNEIFTRQTRWLISGVLIILFAANFGGDENYDRKKNESSSVLPEKSGINHSQLSELQNYLKRGQWTCTSIEKGSAPFMKEATFLFSGNKMIVTSEGTTVENSFEITEIFPNVPNGCKYSALISINDNKDMLTWIDEDIMLLSWGGNKAKLRLQR